jgi:hypothetical protein
MAKTLDRFAREGETITVRNTLDTITVFSRKVNGEDDPLEWQAHGSPTGEDYQEIDAALLRDAKFRKALQRGIFEIVDADDPEVLDAWQAQKSAWDAQRQAKEEADRLVAMQQPRAYSGIQCLAQEGRVQCPEFAISSKNLNEKPPLCSKHAHLAHQFAPEETGKFTDGKPEVNWVRVQMGRI